MRTFKMICTATFLTLVLSLSTIGGEISTPGIIGEIGTPGTIQPATDPTSPEAPRAEDPATESLGGTPLDVVLLAVAALF